MMKYEAVIIGGGPVGFMLASELAMAGVKTCVIERLEKPVPHSKALTLHPRTLELLEMRGILERFVSKGSKIPSGHFSMLDTRLDFSGLDTSCPYTLLLPQSKTEKLLEDHARRLGAEVFRGAEALAVTQNGEAVQTIFKDRDGRIFLAGDAAHIHFPAGGQGLNVGLQDAMNLGWKLAAAIKGSAPSWLLDSYHDERHPAAEGLLRNTEAQTKLIDFTQAGLHLRSMMSELLAFPDVNRYVAGQISALDVRYEADRTMPPNRLNGARLPDMELILSDGNSERLYSFLQNGTFVLLSLRQEADDHIEVKGLRTVTASLAEPNEKLRDVHTILIRPDGHVAWAVDASAPDCAEVIQKGISRWFSVTSRV